MLLLAMHQIFKLKREKAQLSLSMAKRTTRLDRIKKNITNTNKYYTSLFTKLDQQAQQAKNSINTQVSMMNCGGGSMYGGGLLGGLAGGISTLLSSAIGKVCGQVFKQKGADGNETDVTMMDKDLFTTIYNFYQQNGGFTDSTGARLKIDGTEITDDQMNQFNLTRNYVNQGYNQMQQQLVWWQQSEVQRIDNAVAVQKAMLEEQQEAALEPLSYEETMETMDKEYEETRLAEIKEELEAYEQLKKDEIKDSTPHFGLS